MKSLLRTFLLTGLFCTYNSFGQLAFTVTPASQCHLAGTNYGMAGVTTTAATANNYTWSIAGPNCNGTYTNAVTNGSIINIFYACSGTYTITSFAINTTITPGTPVVISSAQMTAAVNPSMALVVNGSTTICQGQSATLTASGGVSYTWNPGNIVSNSIVVSPTTSTQYTVAGANSFGCTWSNLAYVSVGPAVNPVISGTAIVCSGYGVYLFHNLTPSTAYSYTWLPVNTNAATMFDNPTASTCYTLLARHNSSGCSGSAVKCVTVNPSPTLTVVGNMTICAGSSTTLTASGASSYNWYHASSGYTGSTIVITPTSNNYTVYLSGTGPNGCQSYSLYTISLTQGAPISINVSPSNTICLGNNATITASGASSYTWNPGGIASPVIVVQPTTSIVYNVMASHTAGCGTFSTVTIFVQQSSFTVAALGGPSFCAGQTKTLIAGPGSLSYTWISASGVISTSSVAVVSPTANTCYTVLSSGACTSSNSICLTVGSPTVGLQGGIACSGQGIWLYAQGANSYSWSTGTSTTSSNLVYPTVNTCYTVTGFFNSGCPPATAVTCVTVVPSVSFTNNPSSHVVCQGGSVVLAQFPSTYSYSVMYMNNWTWLGSSSGTAVTIFPAVSGVYSFSAYASSMCSGNFTTYISVVPQPSMYISGGSSVCQGSSISLAASGASSYTWYPGGSTGASLLVSPTVNTCYTVTGSNGNGCTATAVKCITVNPVPVVTISGNNNICSGSSTTLTASGAVVYTWPNQGVGSSIVVSPTANTCYMAIGVGAGGCTANAVSCVTVQSTNVLISPSSATVCKNSSATFTASGANSYTWSSGAFTSTVNVLPLVTTNYTVSGTGSNGCIGSGVVTLVVDTTCSMVWPGDANSDGVVSSTDVLEIGLAFLSTGSSRTGASNNYVAQYANNWSGTVSSGKNKCHADCNGNGSVGLSDTVAIFNNFSLTHSFRTSRSHSDITDLTLVSNDYYLMNPGLWNSLDIVLGDNLNEVELAGLVFDLNFDQTLVEQDQAYLEYTGSFLNNANQNVEFRKPIFMNGRIYAASVRTDGNDVAGNGVIARFHFKLRSDLPEGTEMPVSITGGDKIKQDRSHGNLSSNDVLLTLNNNPVGLKENNAAFSASAYPNPAADLLRLKCSSASAVSYGIYDLTGRAVGNGTFEKEAIISTNSLQDGVYFITFRHGAKEITQKLIIDK